MGNLSLTQLGFDVGINWQTEFLGRPILVLGLSMYILAFDQGLGHFRIVY